MLDFQHVALWLVKVTKTNTINDNIPLVTITDFESEKTKLKSKEDK